jgi:aromatic-L-amino-acid decarboxylase
LQQDTSLDFGPEEFNQLLAQASQLIAARFNNLENEKIYVGATPDQFRTWFDEPLLESGTDVAELLELVKQKVLDTATLNMGPHMYAYVVTGGTQVSILAEMLAATINQNVGKWHLSPAISEIEKRVMQWAGQFIGFAPDAGGILVGGGSAANLTGITVARNLFFEKQRVRERGLFGLKPMTMYASSEAHGCMDKSAELLGLGTENYRKIPIMDDCTINLEILEEQIILDKKNGLQPFCLIGNAGTVNTGAIDPLDKMADLAQKYKLWFHVDGAYGGLAAASPLVKEKYKGIERADSLAIDFHKWLYQPFEAGCTLVKDWGQLKAAYQRSATYLSSDTQDDGRFDFNDYHFQLSRNAKALKIWMTFKAYGTAKIIQMIEKDLLLTRYVYDKLEAVADFETCTEPVLGIICFRYIADGDQSAQEVDALNRSLVPALEQDGRVFITGTILKDRPVLRACLINHRKQERHIDYLIETIREVGNRIITSGISEGE